MYEANPRFTQQCALPLIRDLETECDAKAILNPQYNNNQIMKALRTNDYNLKTHLDQFDMKMPKFVEFKRYDKIADDNDYDAEKIVVGIESDGKKIWGTPPSAVFKFMINEYPRLVSLINIPLVRWNKKLMETLKQIDKKLYYHQVIAQWVYLVGTVEPIFNVPKYYIKRKSSYVCFRNIVFFFCVLETKSDVSVFVSQTTRHFVELRKKNGMISWKGFASLWNKQARQEWWSPAWPNESQKSISSYFYSFIVRRMICAACDKLPTCDIYTDYQKYISGQNSVNVFCGKCGQRLCRCHTTDIMQSGYFGLGSDARFMCEVCIFGDRNWRINNMVYDTMTGKKRINIPHRFMYVSQTCL